MASTSNSHLMKTTRRGRPFVKDTHDLFATLIVSLELGNHRYMFKYYPNSFTVDEAAHNLSTLKFSQSTRSPDPADLTRIVTTTTTTTFSMTRDMAKGICQYFMDARLIENATDRSITQFKDRGVYVLTPKGLHILERFITKNGISAQNLLKVFAEQPICMRLLHLERRANDDEILVTRPVLELLFRRFVGKQPNLDAASQLSNAAGDKSGKFSAPSLAEAERAQGVPMWKHTSHEPILKTANRRPTDSTTDFVFSAVAALEWLNDLTTIVGRDEAAEVAAHFVRCGFIALVPDRTMKVIDPSKVTVVRGAGVVKGQAAPIVEAEFRFGDKCIYKITPEGMRAARWETNKTSNRPTLGAPSVSALNLLSTRSSEDADFTVIAGNASEERLTRKPSMADRLRLDLLSIDKVSVKDSYTSKLRQVLEEPTLRSSFREFLRSNFCEENLSFWLDVQDFKRRFNTSSSAVAVPTLGQQQKPGGGHAVMERHQKDLIAMAFVIYNTYLAPASSCELNIDHNMRGELVAYMTKIVAEVSAKEGEQAVKQGILDPAMAAKSLHASQLQTMVKLYERIQGYIFRLMATDSVPKFCKTPEYITQAQIMPDLIDDEDDMKMTGKERKDMGTLETEDLKSPSRSYITISQAANEKQAALLKSKGRTLDEDNARI